MKTKTNIETIDPDKLTTVSGSWGRFGPGMFGWGGVGRGGVRNFLNGQRPGGAGCPGGNCGQQ